MTKRDLLKLLEQFDDDTQICILDDNRNIAEDNGEGSSAGIYPEFEVEWMKDSEIIEGTEPWVALRFENPYVGEENY